MKNLEIRKENINKIKKGFSVAALSLITAISFSTKASAQETTVQDIVNTMINGDAITTELEPQELDKLIDEAETAIIKAGSSLLPKELDEIYSRIGTKKEQENDKEKVAILCDYFLYDGTASAMTYPESLQFERVCEVTCGSLMDEGKTEIYSIYQSNMLGEDVYTELDVIIEQAEKNRDIKEGNVRIAIATDQGYYDHCFGLDKNPNTGLSIEAGLLPLELAVAYLSRKKKEEKTKVKTR